MPITVRTVYLQVTLATEVQAGVMGARGEIAADSGWPTCSVFVKDRPVHTTGEHTGEPIGEENPLIVVAGAGNNVTRFTGMLRKFRTNSFPKATEMLCMGTLAYAAEWAPDETMEMEDIFPTGATDQELIMHCLDQVPQLGSTSYSSDDIAGRSVVMGDAAGGAPENFNWTKGVTAWSRIQEIDRATLYRTYQTRDGTIHRVKMIGHPDETPDFTLGPDDCLEGCTGGRDTERTRNAVIVEGINYGRWGAVIGLALASNSFQGDASNPATRYPEKFNSSLIENGLDPEYVDAGYPGLNAQTIAEEILPDVNKEFVEASIPSWRDDTHGPGLTCTLDMLERLAIGEPMWVVKYAWEVGDRGWTATYGLTGGGLPQTYSPPPV